MGTRRKGRILAMQALYAWDISGSDVLENVELVSEPDLPAETRAFAALLARGAIDNVTSVDDAISRNLQHWEIGRLARVDLAILRLASYELMHQPATPASVAIDEAVHLAKAFGADASFRFVNGVLDAIRRELGR